MAKFQEYARCFYYPLPTELAAVLAECDPGSEHVPEQLKPYLDRCFQEAREKLRREIQKSMMGYAETENDGRRCFYMAATLLYTTHGASVVIAVGTKAGVDVVSEVHRSSKLGLYGEVYRCQVNH